MGRQGEASTVVGGGPGRASSSGCTARSGRGHKDLVGFVSCLSDGSMEWDAVQLSAVR